MRTTRAGSLHDQDRIPLVIRARFERTFFGLGLFAAVILLLCGGYLMVEALVDPLDASEAGVLAAGFTLALSSFLLVYIAWPRGRLQMAKRERRLRLEEKWAGPDLTVYGEAVHGHMEAKGALGDRKDLPGPM